MKKILFAMIAICLVSAQVLWAETKSPTVTLQTSLGDIVLQLDAEKTPVTVNNFLQYVKEGFYDGTIFHRVIKGFMIQGGGLTIDMAKKQTNAPITNEADNGLSNKRGTIAMARTGAPHSATSQFFINTVDNKPLDHRGKTSPQGWGYCVFGNVIKGMEVVDKIAAVPTGIKSGRRDVPTTPIKILHAVVMEKGNK